MSGNQQLQTSVLLSHRIALTLKPLTEVQKWRTPVIIHESSLSVFHFISYTIHSVATFLFFFDFSGIGTLRMTLVANWKTNWIGVGLFPTPKPIAV